MVEPRSSAAPSRSADFGLAPGAYRSLVDASPVLMWRSTEDGGRVYFNPAWHEFTGRTLEQERGEGWNEAVHPDDREPSARLRNQHYHRREPFELEYRLRRHDGTYRDVLERAVPRQMAGRFSGFDGWTVDIEERRQVEQARELFLRMMAHELRTPLQALKVFLELMLRNARAGRPNSPEMFERLGFQLDRFARLIDDIAEAGRARPLEISAERLDLHDRLREIVDNLSEELRSDPYGAPHEIEFRERVLSAPMRGDPERLRLAFTNLLDNALKYSPRGGPVVVELGPRGKEYEVSIRDQGIGIPGEEIRQVGRRFYRASNASARNFRGAGLGLSVAREIIEGHGGHLEIESEPDHGTRVRVLLPRSED